MLVFSVTFECSLTGCLCRMVDAKASVCMNSMLRSTVTAYLCWPDVLKHIYLFFTSCGYNGSFCFVPTSALPIIEEITKIISVINLLSSSNERANIDTISSHLSNEAPSADRLLQILNEAVSRGSIVKSPEDGFYQPARSLRPHRRSFLISQHPSALYDVTAPRRRTTSVQRTRKTSNGASVRKFF